MKPLFTLILGGGIGAPVVATLKKTFEVDLMPLTLKNSETKLDIKWTKENVQGVGSLIDKLGEVLKKDSSKDNNTQTSIKKTVIFGVVLESSIFFQKNICKVLGFDANLKEAEGKEKNNEVICETNLNRKEAIARGEKG
ncbi:hypothetical protein [Mycoplasma parvum]|uniref:hypothetical protein n=1 Tax=Mycoplasma parvum TaxID=984991 RepID=UPI00118408BD|nr:hypothetical protein [Mycoplasma parvum]